MATLRRQTSNEILLSDLKVADSLYPRMKGLLGTAAIGENSGLWIHRCNSVHTFFMNYAIDVVFLDHELVVRAIKDNVGPGRVVWPNWHSTSVVEMRAGRARELNLKPGDQLHVGN